VLFFRCCPETLREYNVAASTALALGLGTSSLKGLLPLASFKCIQWDAVVPPLLQVPGLHASAGFMHSSDLRNFTELNDVGSIHESPAEVR